MKPRFDADCPGCFAEVQIARYRCAITCLRDEARSVELPVAIDHKARDVAEYRRGIEDFRERRSNACRVDITRDVPRTFRRRQTEVVKFCQDIIAGMIAKENKTAIP